MEKTELILLLKTFNTQELKRLGDFVRSPYFNKLKNVSKLFDILTDHGMNVKDLDRKNVFKDVFGTAKFDDARLRVLSARLLALTQKFLAYERYSQNKTAARLDTGRSLIERERNTLFKKNNAEIKKLLEEYFPKDENYYQKLSEFTALASRLDSTYNTSGTSYGNEADNLSIYLTASLLKIYTTAMNTGTVLDMDLDMTRIEKLAPVIEEFKDNPLIQIYYNIYLLLKEPDEEEHFTNVRYFLENNSGVVSMEEIVELYTVLLNYCVLKIASGKKEYAVNKLKIYETMLNKHYLGSEEKKFQYVYFSNIVNSAVENKNYQWAKEFIERYRHSLDPAVGESIVNFCKAKLHYSKGEYESALEFLSKAGNIDDTFYKMALRDLQIKILFDAGHYENIFPIIDSYLHFLKSNKFLNKSAKDNYRQYLKWMKHLVMVCGSANKEKKKEMLFEISKADNFIYKGWITDKLVAK